MPVGNATAPIQYRTVPSARDDRPGAAAGSVPVTGVPASANDTAKLREAAKGFEEIFARQILASMQSTLTEGSLFGSGPEGKIYSDFFEEALAKTIAESGDLGLADLIVRQQTRRAIPAADTVMVLSPVPPRIKESEQP